jgi:hypothetical protein
MRAHRRSRLKWLIYGMRIAPDAGTEAANAQQQCAHAYFPKRPFSLSFSFFFSSSFFSSIFSSAFFLKRDLR